MSIDSKDRYPQDVVAIFHASFHPTHGNVIDWSQKASDDLNLDNLEFNALPSGLHLVDEDVIYFTKDGQHGVCVFRRRKTAEHGQRGFRLSSLGILLAKSVRPRPWRHTSALKDLATAIYSKLEVSGILEPKETDWLPALTFFNERKVKRADLSGVGDWNGWRHELDGLQTDATDLNPTLHLPHLLRILGPSSLMLYKHVFGRQRILIYTLPPVQAACILCQVAADMCYEDQVHIRSSQTPQKIGVADAPRRLQGKCREGITVLGMVTLNDLERMKVEGESGRGWIACTTDAIFLEKPSHYDLLIDLTTSTPNKASRPTFYVSRPVQPQPGAKGPSHRLSVSRFVWSDVKLWTELDRLLQLDSECDEHHSCCGPSGGLYDAKSKFITTWTDAWRVYEDVCIVCAGLWMGSWRSNSTMSYSTANGSGNWGSVRLDGDDDLTVGGYVRNVGMGIEGGPSVSSSSETGHLPAMSTTPTAKAMKGSSGMSWSSGNASSSGFSRNGKTRQVSSSSTFISSTNLPEDGTGEADGNADEIKDRHFLTTLALLQTFHAHISFHLSTLESFLDPSDTSDSRTETLYLTPKDVLCFELGPLSSFDARYLGWIVKEYADRNVVVKRGWKDLLGVMFGFN